MSSISCVAGIIALFVIVCGVNGQSLEVGEKARQAVREFIDNKLPPTARADGEDVLSTLNQGLNICEQRFNSNNLIVDYNKCATEYLRIAMVSLSEIASESWPSYVTSGASKLKLFW